MKQLTMSVFDKLKKKQSLKPPDAKSNSFKLNYVKPKREQNILYYHSMLITNLKNR